jgi:hypothetical protein
MGCKSGAVDRCALGAVPIERALVFRAPGDEIVAGGFSETNAALALWNGDSKSRWINRNRAKHNRHIFHSSLKSFTANVLRAN